jgi:hypothetical protein
MAKDIARFGCLFYLVENVVDNLSSSVILRPSRKRLTRRAYLFFQILRAIIHKPGYQPLRRGELNREELKARWYFCRSFALPAEAACFLLRCQRAFFIFQLFYKSLSLMSEPLPPKIRDQTSLLSARARFQRRDALEAPSVAGLGGPATDGASLLEVARATHLNSERPWRAQSPEAF